MAVPSEQFCYVLQGLTGEVMRQRHSFRGYMVQPGKVRNSCKHTRHSKRKLLEGITLNCLFLTYTILPCRHIYGLSAPLNLWRRPQPFVQLKRAELKCFYWHEIKLWTFPAAMAWDEIIRPSLNCYVFLEADLAMIDAWLLFKLQC